MAKKRQRYEVLRWEPGRPPGFKPWHIFYETDSDDLIKRMLKRFPQETFKFMLNGEQVFVMPEPKKVEPRKRKIAKTPRAPKVKCSPEWTEMRKQILNREPKPAPEAIPEL